MTSTIANTVSTKYNARNPHLAATEPAVLMIGFRAGGWVCCATVVIAIVISLFGMRGIGLVGQQHAQDLPKKSGPSDDIEMTAQAVSDSNGQPSRVLGSHASSTATLTDGSHSDAKKDRPNAD